MRCIISFVCGVIAHGSGLLNKTATEFDAASKATALWSEWKQRWGQDYGAEEARRFDAFSENLRFIEEENSKNLTFSLGLNEFSGLTTDEFRQMYASGARGMPMEMLVDSVDNETLSTMTPRSSIDWAALGYVTRVKNQGQCGSCWAFSTTGSIESAYAIAMRQAPVEISEQQFVDCDNGFVHQGCRGANVAIGFATAYQWAESRNLCSESSYQYIAAQGTCHEQGCQAAIPRGAVTGWSIVPPFSTTMMANAVAGRPVSVAVDAGSALVMSYTGGVISGSCGGQLDHAVLVVGYGNAGLDYWKIKNSWGAMWGENGYFRIEKGKWNALAGECGVLSVPAYPRVYSGSNIVV